MRIGRAALARAVDSVVEGTDRVDWGLITIELDNERDRELLGHIRVLSQISDIQRTEAAALHEDERELRARAQTIASLLPFAVPARPPSDDVAGAEAPTISQDLGPAADAPRWGRLELLELVGKGTFGDVYRARDSQLQREVAVKLLHGGRPHDGLADRMLHEARALARVEHPNVVVVHDAEERDGRAGLCMEFVRGRTLEAILLSDGPRGAGEAALIGQELCQALSAVHAAGLVHRDVKAQNVMREDGGRVVLMDFGAGLQLSEGQARAGSVTGTPLYLAPEVLEHGETSVRSDIYSLGVLLYHLVSNEYPVRGQTPAELVEAHRKGRVRRLRDVAPRCPAWFVRAVERAIATDPRERYATAGEFEAALGGRTTVNVRPLVLTAGVVMLTLAVVAGLRSVWPAGPPASSPPLVALLPLEPGLGVSAPVAAAISDEIYQGLAMVDTVRVISSFSAARAKRDQPSMPQIANVLQASTVIDGTVIEANGQFEVKLRVFDAGSDSARWAGVLTASPSGLGALRRDGAMAIARAINAAVSPRVLRLLSRPASANAQAYDAYARGRERQARGTRADLEGARDELEHAIELDESYAPAYAALARVRLDLGANGRRSEWVREGELARIAARRALDLEPQLVEGHVAMGQVAFLLDWDWQSAENAFREAMALSPGYDYARQRNASLLAARGHVDDALRELETSRRLDPLSDSIDSMVIPILQYAGRFAEAETLLTAVRNRLTNPLMVHNQLGRIYAATGRFDRAIEEFQQLEDSPTGSAYVEAEIAAAMAGAGRLAEAQAILDRLHERSRTEEIPPEVFSLVYVRLGRVDDAFRYIEQAVAQKSRRVIWLKVDPRWAPLRGDARFESLVKRLQL